MKLEKILDNLNSFEKGSFIKAILCVISNNPEKSKEIEKIFEEPIRDLKGFDSERIVRVFLALENEYMEYLKPEYFKITSQLDIFSEILTRDGNCIMQLDWFSRLYETELKLLKNKIEDFRKKFDDEKSDIEESRRRDYRIYWECLKTAYENDLDYNQDSKITYDEQSILNTLIQQLGLSHEETKLINYLTIPPKKYDCIDDALSYLKSIGVIFIKKNTVYIADEIVKILRKIRGKEIADKFFRRFLKLLKDSQINQICRKHNIEWKSSSPEEKIRSIINQGISFTEVLANDIHKPNSTLTEKKKTISELFEKGLNITTGLKGSTVEEKIISTIHYFETVEKDEKVEISVDGYEKLLCDIKEILPSLNSQLKTEFQLQEENVLQSSYLLDFNIKPRDILELIAESDLEKFCMDKNIKTRGDKINNILDSYKDSENLYLENYENIGFRNLNVLKENGINTKESDLGIKFEDLTKLIFKKLGLNVDEKLRNSLNTVKDKIDMILQISPNEIIIVECKTIKESGYNKFSAVSRQLKSYINLAEKNNYRVIRTILVAPDFSEEFVNECRLDYELNLCLVSAKSLLKILEGFKASKHKKFPFNLLMKDVLIQDDIVLKALGR
ncbi:MAG: hypothetical protein PHP14_02860 [Candidatus Pacebacteria bacterium]|nr:hypothetical protein [Candidatus Paceibacterota bacterium]